MSENPKLVVLEGYRDSRVIERYMDENHPNHLCNPPTQWHDQGQMWECYCGNTYVWKYSFIDWLPTMPFQSWGWFLADHRDVEEIKPSKGIKNRFSWI